MSKRKGWLWAGIMGAVAGLLLAPKAGKETRKELETWVKKLRAELKKGKKTGEKIIDELSARVAKLKETGKGIDKNKYGQMVDEIVDEFKDKGQVKKASVAKLKLNLKKDWKLVQTALKEKSEAGK